MDDPSTSRSYHFEDFVHGVQRPPSNALWAPFDDTEGRWGSRERHIEGGHRLGETFQCQAAEVFECDYFLYCCSDATGDQDLAILRFSTEPSGQVAHGADSGIAGALGKADLAKRRVALGDAGAKTCGFRGKSPANPR